MPVASRESHDGGRHYCAGEVVAGRAARRGKLLREATVQGVSWLARDEPGGQDGAAHGNYGGGQLW